MKLLIVDDEKIIRQGMIYGYDWKKDGIDEVYEARNGLEAVEIINKYSPDIIITDIRMPKMDGIELAEYVYKNYPDIHIIMLSGFAEFDYAQRAIKYNVGEYLLKPTRIEEIAEVVQQTKAKIEINRMANQRMDNLEKRLEKNFPYIKNQYLNELINGNNTGECILPELRTNDAKNSRYIVAVLGVDKINKISDWNGDLDYKIVKYAVINILEELLAEKFAGVVFEDAFEHIIVIVNLSECDEKKAVMSFFEKSIKCIENNINLTVTVGVGCVYKFEQINMSYNEGLDALNHKFLLGKNRVIDIDDIWHKSSEEIEYPRSIEENLMECLDISDMAGVDLKINEFFMYFRKQGSITIEVMKRICVELIFVLSRHLHKLGLEKYAEEIEGNKLYEHDFQKSETIDEMYEYMRDIFRTAAESIQENFHRKNKSVIITAIKYIEAHLNEDISLKAVADKVHMSPNYFTSLFKQETGKKFSEYVSEKRIEKAKGLLMDRDIKTYEVAEMVGYSDSRYFSQFFRRHTGMAPSEFRNRSIK